MALGKHASALSDYENVSLIIFFSTTFKNLIDYEKVTKVCPHDKDAIMKYEECKKVVTQRRFEKAITVNVSTQTLVNKIDLSSMSKPLHIRPGNRPGPASGPT